MSDKYGGDEGGGASVDGGRETPEGMHTYGAHDNSGKLMGSFGKVDTELETSTIGDRMREDRKTGVKPEHKFFPRQNHEQK